METVKDTLFINKDDVLTMFSYYAIFSAPDEETLRVNKEKYEAVKDMFSVLKTKGMKIIYKDDVFLVYRKEL